MSSSISLPARMAAASGANGGKPAAIKSALMNREHCASFGRKDRAKVVFPAPFGPAIMMIFLSVMVLYFTRFHSHFAPSMLPPFAVSTSFGTSSIQSEAPFFHRITARFSLAEISIFAPWRSLCSQYPLGLIMTSPAQNDHQPTRPAPLSTGGLRRSL